MKKPAEATGAKKPEDAAPGQRIVPNPDSEAVDDIVKTTFRLPREAFTEFKAAAAFNNETMSAAITRLMLNYAEETEKLRAARRKK